jgi:hypothetical protein
MHWTIAQHFYHRVCWAALQLCAGAQRASRMDQCCDRRVLPYRSDNANARTCARAVLVGGNTTMHAPKDAACCASARTGPSRRLRSDAELDRKLCHHRVVCHRTGSRPRSAPVCCLHLHMLPICMDGCARMAAWPWRYACNCVHDSALVKMAPWIILRSLSGLACCPPHGLHAPATHRAPMSWSLTCMCLMDAQECADAGRIVGTALPADSAAGTRRPTD